ncbi:ribosome recycling factor [Candidatus Shapirobacteria bacterium]|nr:ribosome recycling factor [Candidatus Shapirobacteria bacterium]
MISENLDQLKAQMEKALGVLAGELAVIRTGRATPALVENIRCSVYQGKENLRVVELANISAPDTQTLVITPWDPTIIEEIAKGIASAGLNLNPVADGQLIRISLPPLTTERREEMVHLLHRQLENGRVMIRQVRHEFLSDLKKAFEAKEIDEDSKFGAEKKVQEMTDEFVGRIDELGKVKEEEITRF